MIPPKNPPLFLWTYDQLQRYAVLRLLIEKLGAGEGDTAAAATGASSEEKPGESGKMERVLGPESAEEGKHGRVGEDEESGGRKNIPTRSVRVLDVGGAAADRDGSGFWLPAAEILVGTGAAVTVVDVSDCLLPGFIKASGSKLPFATGSYDVVSAFDVLEHIPGNERAAFVSEISRIASRAVLLSCPTKSPGVEQAEALLYGEIKNHCGLEHGMLAEHKAHGLPLEAEVEAALSGAGLTAVSFGYGALSTWLTYQVFRSSFLARVESARAIESIDWYWAGQPQAAELSSPHYRRFWIASKTIGGISLMGLETAMRKELKEKGLRPVLKRAGIEAEASETPGGGKTGGTNSGEGDRIQARPEDAPGVDAFDSVVRVTRGILARPFVSALVVTAGEPAILGPCLDTLLTQVVDFTLEVAVWNFDRSAEAAGWLAAHYPQVKVIEGDGDFPGVMAKLRGDYIFFMDEKLLPVPDAVSRYVGLIQPETAESVLAVSAPWRGGFPESWTGMARSAWKRAKGLGVKSGIVGDTSQIREDWEIVPKFKGWVIGDALFFRRAALPSRKAAPISDRHSVFLWEYK